MTDPVPTFLMVSAIDEPCEVVGAAAITAGCGHLSWLSPTGMAFLINNAGVQTRCTDCVDPNDVTEMSAMPGGVEDLAKYLGRPVAEALIAEAKRDGRNVVRTLQAENRRRRRKGKR